jgi:hypothetical protein
MPAAGQAGADPGLAGVEQRRHAEDSPAPPTTGSGAAVVGLEGLQRRVELEAPHAVLLDQPARGAHSRRAAGGVDRAERMSTSGCSRGGFRDLLAGEGGVSGRGTR